MVDFQLMRGDKWFRCCLCGELHEFPYPNAYVDEKGTIWDSCKECWDK